MLTVKNGVLRYTFSGVVEEWLFQHPVYHPFSPEKLQLGAYSHSGLIDDILTTTPQCGYALNQLQFAGENGG